MLGYVPPCICLPMVCRRVHHPGIYYPSTTPGTPSRPPATAVHGSGLAERRKPALTRAVTERTVADMGVTVVASLLPVSLLVSVEERDQCCAESPAFLWERINVAQSALPPPIRSLTKVVRTVCPFLPVLIRMLLIRRV